MLVTSLGRLPGAGSQPEFAAQLSKPLKASQLYDVLVSVLAEQTGEGRREPVSGPRASETSALRILLVEDNAVNQTVALGLLQRLGYQADVAWNGREALEALERAQYDVVLMDVQMPEVDGLEASRRIRERWPNGGPRIVAMTANVLAEDREACLAAGMDDYVAKPIRPEALSEALRRVGFRDNEDGAGADDGAVRLDPGALENLRQIGGDDFLVELIDAFLVDAPGQLAMLRRLDRAGRTRTRFGESRTRSSRTARRSAPTGSPSSAGTSRNGRKTAVWTGQRGSRTRSRWSSAGSARPSRRCPPGRRAELRRGRR